MRVVVYRELPLTESLSTAAMGAKDLPPMTATVLTNVTQDSEEQPLEYINMANGLLVTILGWLIWTFIAGLNVYLIVMLCLGRS